jgi:hypothetical protein
MKHKPVAALGTLAAVAIALVMALPAGAAGNGGTEVTTSDPTGAVFTCPGVEYTVLGGTLRSVFRDSVAANGSEHVTGTDIPIGVTLGDGVTDTVYRLAGASWFGGSFDEATQRFVFTDTEHFNILGPSGGVIARVSLVEHMSSAGASFSFDGGVCQPPQD